LAQTREALELGFQIEAIRRLLALQDMPERSCEEVDAMTRDHLAEIDRKIRALESLRDELTQTLDQYAGGDEGAFVVDCRQFVPGRKGDDHSERIDGVLPATRLTNCSDKGSSRGLFPRALIRHLGWGVRIPWRPGPLSSFEAGREAALVHTLCTNLRLRPRNPT
jgi:MerR, DNA binding